MLPRERVIAALEHREGDLIPWGEHSINYNVYEDILGRPSFVQAQFKETKALWDGRRDEVVASYKRDKIDLTRALGMDIICVGACPGLTRSEPMQQIDEVTYRDRQGSVYRISSTTHDLMPYKRNTDNYVPPTMASLEERMHRAKARPLPDVNAPEWEVLRHIVKEMKATHFIAVLCGDVAWPSFGATEEDQWMNLVLEEDLCRKLCEVRQVEVCREVEFFAKMGVDAIMPCGDLGTSTGLFASPEIYRQRIYPVNKAHAAAAHKHGLWILKHCCGHTWPVIDELADCYDAYEGIQASAGMDIGKLKQRVGDRLCLWGGIWHEHIIMGTPQDIRQDACYAFSQAGPGGGYIMGSSHSLAVGAKLENILEMKRCRDESGQYPIRPERFR